MKQTQSRKRRRLKAIGAALGSIALGIALLVFSQKIKPEPITPAADGQPTTTAPAAPETPADPGDRLPARDPQRAGAQNMSGLALLFSTMFFLLALILVGWVIYDVRESRPAWQKQKKYPVRR